MSTAPVVAIVLSILSIALSLVSFLISLRNERHDAGGREPT